MKIVFFGTPDYVVGICNSLHKTFKEKGEGSPIVAVVTQKPKPKGRKKILSYSPLDKWAHKKNVPIFFNSLELTEKNIQADIGVLAAYGSIIDGKVINHFPHGIINIHPSCLPKYKGASPVQAAIISGEKETGVSFIKMDNLIDHGPIISSIKEKILPSDTSETLRNRLFEKSQEALCTLLPAYIESKINLQEQDHSKETFTTQVNKADGFIPPKYLDAALIGKELKEKWQIAFIRNSSLSINALSLERFIRAMTPWPIAWTNITLQPKISKTGKRLKILKAHTKKGKLLLDLVQLEGRNEVSWKQFIQGYPKAKLI